MTRFKAPLAALLSGLLFTGAFPPFNQWWLAWLWMLPFLLVLWSPARERGGAGRFFRGAGLGWMTGFFLFTGTLWWVSHVTLPGMFALCAFLALYPALWAGLSALWQPRSPGRGLVTAVALAFVWAGLEWLRSVLLTGFPWNGAAAPLVEMPGVRSLAAFGGVTGLSMVPVFFMSGAAASWSLRRHRSSGGRALLMVLSLSTPAVLSLINWSPTPLPTGSVEVMLVQPNVPMHEKLNPEYDGPRYDDLLKLTLEEYAGAKTKPDFVVWPESAIPHPFHEQENDAPLNAILKMGPFTLITGSDAMVADDDLEQWDMSNCVVALRETRTNFDIRGKVHLVPFGEYIPLRKELPFLEDMLGDLIPRDFRPGKVIEPMQLDGMACGVIPLVCFEDTIADLARRFVRAEPQLMVNVTNDNWFHDSPESLIHALNARWRCLELQRPMVRSANTGFTCVIDPDGRVTSSLPVRTRGALHTNVLVYPGTVTFYAAHGEIVSMVAGIAGLVLGLGLMLTSQRSHQ